MKSKSQLDWFYTLPNLLKNDSGYLNIKWQTTNRAKANIIRISQQQNTKNEAIIARIVYENLSAAVQGDVTVENWTAFLSRHSEKAAKKIQEKLIASGTLSSQELVNSFEELILISFTFASQPILFLANFKCQEVSDYIWYKILHGYCQKKAQGKLIDRWRNKQGSKTFMRSNLGLVAKATETKVIESLMLAGIRDTELERYLIIWRCFIEVKQAQQINLKFSQNTDYLVIIERINYLKTKGKIDINIFSNVELENSIQANLETIGKAIRYYIDPPMISLDTPISSDNQNSLSELIPDNSSITDSDLTSVEQNLTLDNLTLQVYEYLEQIERLQWIVLFLRELVQLKQTEIAVMIACTQKTVSLKYRKSWQELIKNLITQTGSNSQNNSSLSSENLTDLKEGLVNIVCNYFQSAIQNYYRSLSQTHNSFTSNHLLTFLQKRLENKPLVTNDNLLEKLDNFVQKLDYLS